MPYSSSLTDKEWELIEPLLPKKMLTKLLTWSKREILLDNGHHPVVLIKALVQIYPQIMTKIQFELAPKLTPSQKQVLSLAGFVAIATRWVIERSNAWMERCKSS